MPESMMPILMPAPALETPPSVVQAAGAFMSCVALLTVGCILRIGITSDDAGEAAHFRYAIRPWTRRIQRSPAWTPNPLTLKFREASADLSAACRDWICAR